MLCYLWIFVDRSFYVVRPGREALGQVSIMCKLLMCDVLSAHISDMNYVIIMRFSLGVYIVQCVLPCVFVPCRQFWCMPGMFAATHKEMRDRLQLSNKDSGQQNALQAEQNKRR
jgi:hypothetical protein